MQLRTRSDKTIRSLVDAATIAPFFQSLLALRQARKVTPELSHTSTHAQAAAA